MSTSYLFVYGTLLPGRAPPAVADVVGRMRVVGPGSVRGRLFDLGAYPGCVLDEGCEQMVHGQVLEITGEVESTLAKLDWYEDFAASDLAGSLFVRRVCSVMLEGVGQVEGWVYVYNRDVVGRRLVESGRWNRFAGVCGDQ